MQFNNGPDHPMTYNTIDLQNNENNEKLLVSFYLQLVPNPISIVVLNFPQKLNLNYRWIEEVDDQAQYTTCTNHEEQYNQAHMLYTMLAHWQKRYVYNLMSFFLHNNKPEWGICV